MNYICVNDVFFHRFDSSAQIKILSRFRRFWVLVKIQSRSVRDYDGRRKTTSECITMLELAELRGYPIVRLSIGFEVQRTGRFRTSTTTIKSIAIESTPPRTTNQFLDCVTRYRTGGPQRISLLANATVGHTHPVPLNGVLSTSDGIVLGRTSPSGRRARRGPFSMSSTSDFQWHPKDGPLLGADVSRVIPSVLRPLESHETS